MSQKQVPQNRSAMNLNTAEHCSADRNLRNGRRNLCKDPVLRNPRLQPYSGKINTGYDKGNRRQIPFCRQWEDPHTHHRHPPLSRRLWWIVTHKIKTKSNPISWIKPIMPPKPATQPVASLWSLTRHRSNLAPVRPLKCQRLPVKGVPLSTLVHYH